MTGHGGPKSCFKSIKGWTIYLTGPGFAILKRPCGSVSRIPQDATFVCNKVEKERERFHGTVCVGIPLLEDQGSAHSFSG